MPIRAVEHSGLRILFITAVSPELAVGGGGAATRSFLDVLRSAPINACVDILPLRTRRAILPHKGRQLLALLRSTMSSLPSKSLFDATSGAIDRIKTKVGLQSYDLMVINSGELFFLTRYIPSSQATLGLALNVESELYAQQTRALRNLPLVGQYFSRDLEKLRREETDGIKRLGGVVCLSADDASTCRLLAPDVPTLSLPTSFSYNPYERETNRIVHRPLRLGFLAKYGWWPNAEAVEWLVRRILPALPVGCAQLNLYGPGGERFKGRHPSITIHGFVNDLTEVWAQSDIIVCPMVSGSGINIKLVEALYNRCPVLATSYATRGLPHVDDPAIVRLDTPEEWIQFLSSDRAERLARVKPQPNISALFSIRSAAPILADFIATIKDGGTKALGRARE